MNLRDEAKWRHCMVRIPGHCNGDPATTVLAHKPGAGLAVKSLDMHGAWCCSGCHDVVDMRVRTEHPRSSVMLWFYEAILRTQAELVREGKLKW